MTTHESSAAARLVAYGPSRRWSVAIGANGALVLLLALVALTALSVGRYPLSVVQIIDFLRAAAGLDAMDPAQYQKMQAIIVQMRLPRVLNAMLVGAALSASGSAFQAVFRNPMVSPGLLGVMSGASFGAALGIIMNQNWFMIQALAFVMGLFAVAVGVAIANIFGRASMIMLVLGGVISGGLFSSLLTLMKFLADPTDQLASIISWLMGDLAGANLRQIGFVSIPILFGIMALTALGKAMDALAMGDEEALTLGVPIHLVRYAIIAAATLVCALTVSIAGMIGWIGLIMPHIARMMFGPNNARLMPAATLLGASFLVGVDALSRALTNIEVPIGVVMELLGIPIFLIVLRRSHRGWN